jgi:hypothetical protein
MPKSYLAENNNVKVLEWTQERGLPVVHRRGSSRNLSHALDETYELVRREKDSFYQGRTGRRLVMSTGVFSPRLWQIGGKCSGRLVVPPAYADWVLRDRQNVLLALTGDSLFANLPVEVKFLIVRLVKAQIAQDHGAKPDVFKRPDAPQRGPARVFWRAALAGSVSRGPDF